MSDRSASSPPAPPQPRFVYKIMTADDWAAARAAGRYDGAAIDRADGFVHLSAADQVAGTLAAHFAGRADLVLVAFDADDLVAAGLVWEPSRAGALFPHLYGALDPARACAHWPLALDAAGRHALPDPVLAEAAADRSQGAAP
ncbi:hypothetical protein CCR85_12250 [Rhodothalassium salexigens]|uniref:DUF952 domain-containing protein n=1 Tax=Rhodothalassium salexigens TaxID=1086 RepID=UPI001912C6D1|nr:DUF952 domain-containing protein [Rhodothalassium salexigens]MBK5912261.1 hypothetical protein [Rhodothalassium salexigens]MBK5921418.1 hypothetical protein [Rhodothalassium salexigens]